MATNALTNSNEHILPFLAEHPMPGALPAYVFSALTRRIDAALTHQTENPAEADDALRTLVCALSADFTTRLMALPLPVRDAVTGDKCASTELAMAFEMGKLAFAQLLVSSVAAKLPDPAFYTAYQDPEFSSIIQALIDTEATVNGIATRLDSTQTKVERALHTLCYLGIVDFRRAGLDVTLYFLTQSGRDYYDRK